METKNIIQHSKRQSILYHLYPGVLITLFFALAAPYFVAYGFPPQLAMLSAIAIVVMPILIGHLKKAKEKENLNHIRELVSYNAKLPDKNMLLYVGGLILFAFLIYGISTPLNTIITEKIFYWLPEWYKVSELKGYSQNVVMITLIANLVLNGLLAPFLEEVYFRGYLLPRMRTFGNYAPWMNVILFSLYHFWQPQIYLTLVIALAPMTYLTWKKKSLKLAIYTHCGLNIVGTILTFIMMGTA